jgi:molybdenum cofactor biosynthesis enzyme MoaA
MSSDSNQATCINPVEDFTNYGNWCPAVYHGLYAERWNDDEVRIAPCCVAHPAIEPRDQFNFNTSPYLNSLREQFDRGEKPNECRRCWNYETYNAGTTNYSRRQKTIITYQYATQKSEPDRSIVLTSLDYFCAWVCNLACVICRPLNSSLWSSELKQTKEERKATGRLFELKPQPSLADQLDFGDMYRVHFNGGEPLATKEHIRVLEKLATQGRLQHTSVSYNTNGTMYPSDEVIALWKQAKKVHVSFSIDATERAFEYIRYPANWEQVSGNMVRMKKELTGNMEYGFTVAVGALNVFEMPKLWEWYSNNMTNPNNFYWQFVNELDMGRLENNVKLEAIKLLKDYPSFDGIANYLQETIIDPEVIKQNPQSYFYPLWSEQLDTIDARRGTNWKESLDIGKYYR